MNPEIEELAITHPFSYAQVQRVYEKAGRSKTATEWVLNTALSRGEDPDKVSWEAQWSEYHNRFVCYPVIQNHDRSYIDASGQKWG